MSSHRGQPRGTRSLERFQDCCTHAVKLQSRPDPKEERHSKQSDGGLSILTALEGAKQASGQAQNGAQEVEHAIYSDAH